MHVFSGLFFLNNSELTAHLAASVTAPLWQVGRGAVSAPGREPVGGPRCTQELLAGRTDGRRKRRLVAQEVWSRSLSLSLRR